MEKIVKNCYAFDYYHCYLSTVLDQDTARYRMCSEQEKRVSLTEPYTTQLIQFVRIPAEFVVRCIRYQHRVKVIKFSIAA